MASPGSPTLALVPSELEARGLADLGGLPAGLAVLELCGFGPLSAAARTAALLELVEPRRVLLIGIAGAYEVARHPVGSALVFSRVGIEGLGAGAGEGLRTPTAMGFPQVPSSARAGSEEDEQIALAQPAGWRGKAGSLLLTTCAASAGALHAAERRRRHPAAVAEDMEGFAVALACALRGVPLSIVRGISNQVGDRDPAHWRVPLALRAALELATLLLSEREPWEVAR